jgi:hypothetical protein
MNYVNVYKLFKDNVSFMKRLVLFLIVVAMVINPFIDFNKINISLMESKPVMVNAVGSYGDIINTNVSTYEWDTQEGRQPYPIRLNNSEYYLISFGGETGTEYDGYLRTIKIYNDNGTIHPDAISTYEFFNADVIDNYARSRVDMCWIPNTDKYLIVYEDVWGGKTNVSTIQVWDTNGTINPSLIDTITLTYNGSYMNIINVVGNVYNIAYRKADDNDGWMETIWVNNSGTINDTILDIQTFDTTCFTPTMVMVDSDTVAIVYQLSGLDGYISTWNITSSGVITNTKADGWEFDTQDCYNPDFMRLSGNVYVITYASSGYQTWVNTTTITPDGMMTKTWIDSLQYENAGGYTGNYPSFFTVNNQSVYGILYMERPSYLEKIVTFNMSSNGTIANSVITTVLGGIFSGSGNTVPFCIYVNKSYYLNIYECTGADGWSHVSYIDTNYASPTVTAVTPINNAVDVSICPTWFNVSVTDEDGSLMDVYGDLIIEGCSQDYAPAGSVGNGTVSMLLNGAMCCPLDYATTYTWYVNVTDGTFWTNTTFNFTTEDAPVGIILGVPSPVNGSTNQPLTGGWCIQINETNGNTFDYNISLSNGQYSAFEGASNGTFCLAYSLLMCNTNYTVWVNVTSRDTNNSKFWFWTEPCCYNPNSSYYTFNITWCCNISNDAGLIMEWNITCNNSQYVNGSSYNGTICINLTNCSICNYTFWVNVTEGVCWDNETYYLNMSGSTASASSTLIIVDNNMFSALLFASLSSSFMLLFIRRRKRKQNKG